jgi:Domain of unknown function (DUF4258)
MRFTRHAKNRARRLGITVADVEEVIADPTKIDFDKKGKPRYTGCAGNIRLRVVVALDEPELIVTIHDRRR